MSKFKFTSPSRYQLGTYPGTPGRSLPRCGQGQPDENHQASPAPVPRPCTPGTAVARLWAALRENSEVRFPCYPWDLPGLACSCFKTLGPLSSAFRLLLELIPTHSDRSSWVSGPCSGLRTERCLCRWASYIFQLAKGRGF